jgi:hypothetical protein
MDSDYKTEMCPEFESNVACEAGLDCVYAHGIKELRSLANPLYKVQICPAFQQIGDCQMGDHCLFAHSQEELRDDDVAPVVKNSPQHPAKPVAVSAGPGRPRTFSNTGGASAEDKAAVNYKTALCMYFAKGNPCPNGNDCPFAHGDAELRGTNVPDPNDPKYKTKLCIRFEQENFCASGDKCQFAHGEVQLRVGGATEKAKVGLYKTSLCNNFSTIGVCPNGKNCSFAHGRYELRPAHFAGDFEKKVSENPRWKCMQCNIFVTRGSCIRQDCDFAHGDQELRSMTRDEPSKGGASANYKTTLCIHFQKQGFCRMDTSCSFAHGDQELRAFNAPPKLIKSSNGQVMIPRLDKADKPANYKSVMCGRWEKQGQCNIGDNCTFAHGAEELRAPGMFHPGSHPGSLPGSHPGSAGPPSMPMPMAPMGGMLGRGAPTLKRPAAAYGVDPYANMGMRMGPPAEDVTTVKDVVLFEEFLEFKKFKDAQQTAPPAATDPYAPVSAGSGQRGLAQPAREMHGAGQPDQSQYFVRQGYEDYATGSYASASRYPRTNSGY